jgi:hypothetical protein
LPSNARVYLNVSNIDDQVIAFVNGTRVLNADLGQSKQVELAEFMDPAPSRNSLVVALINHGARPGDDPENRRENPAALDIRVDINNNTVPGLDESFRQTTAPVGFVMSWTAIFDRT